MRVLIIKTSSMGDIVHTLPALTDAGKFFSTIRFDWVVEENFAAIPKWHPLVDKVIPVALRRWRKSIFSSSVRREWREFRQNLQQNNYDFIIDAQGLLKSALLTRIAKAKRKCGFNWQSIREPLASIFYHNKIAVPKNQHAITRTRALFASVLGYELPLNIPEYDINPIVNLLQQEMPYLVFLHGTTWATKHWPEKYWIELAKLANKAGYGIKLLWGNKKEEQRAKTIAATVDNAEVLPPLTFENIANVLSGAKGVITVDTGLGHLAAALDLPTIALYGPTDPVLTGTLGRSQKHLTTQFACAPCLARECKLIKNSTVDIFPPCFTDMLPNQVWLEMAKLLD